MINRLTPNDPYMGRTDPYMGRTAPLTSKLCILFIYSTNIGTEYFKHALYSPFFSSKCSLFHNANLFGSCIIHTLYTECAKIKKNNSGARRLTRDLELRPVRSTGIWIRSQSTFVDRCLGLCIWFVLRGANMWRQNARSCEPPFCSQHANKTRSH